MTKLKNNLPSYYRKSDLINSLAKAIQKELDELDKSIINRGNQFYVDSSDTSLDRYEKDLKINIDINKDLNERRSVIKSKLRGIGTVNVDMIKNVAESYDKGTIEVREDNPNLTFIVKFIDTLGIPLNIWDLKRAIEEIKPAHLRVKYELKYLTVGEVQKMTLGQIQNRKLGDFSPFKPILGGGIIGK
ncbi:MAG: YmfQ family protein [Anaeromicrobium sp.]|jgi:hypothetical protein|uniref:putative phage tail protein n=1 Tax=Anaeromicrobium sp. TaxID=1929132 RepID=UPI0025ED6E45|nr:putative phage tail protein [Anaeromicrobium sp.]MCT4593591.1 YmfQ family protein [Anaeromicrobium sp.]